MAMKCTEVEDCFLDMIFSFKHNLQEKIAMPTSYAEETIIDISLFREPNWDPDCCIYKVPKRLRNVKDAAYTPKLILIGPVHHIREEPENMKIVETLKKRYFNIFFSRTKKIRDDFEKIVEKNKDKIRHCYAEEITLPEGKNFVDMILLDSIFIIELFLRSTEAKEEGKDYILSKPWLKYGIRQDLILLENQRGDPGYPIEEERLIFQNRKEEEKNRVNRHLLQVEIQKGDYC
nr:upf0481 protein [Quercus suber]